jgi:hypothetical protein
LFRDTFSNFALRLCGENNVQGTDLKEYCYYHNSNSEGRKPQYGTDWTWCLQAQLMFPK